MSTDPTLQVQHVENNQGAAQDEAEGGARGYKRSRQDAAGNHMATRTSSRRQQGEAPLRHGEGIHTNEQGDGNSDDGNNDDDDDDDPVETPATGAGGGGAPSRVNPFPGIGRGGQGGQLTTPATGAGGGGAPSRVTPFAGIGRGGQGGQFTTPATGAGGGGAPSRVNPFAGVGRGGQGGDYNQSPRDGVDNGVGPPSRGANQFAGNVPGGQGGNWNPFGAAQGRHDERELGAGVGNLLPALQQEGRRAMSYRTAKGVTKKNVRQRIQVTLKTVIFRGVKFITCPAHFDLVMQKILEQERPADVPQFIRMYKTIVQGALNTKRSTCEQSAQEAAMRLFKNKNHRDEVEPPPYSMTNLCKLRQSQTEEEKEAFLWFADELLECVCGKRAWGTRKKYRATISNATSNDTGDFIVSVSDEAFALLLYEAYIDKWIKRYHEDRRGEARSKRIVGRYTKTDGSSAEYGGWSEEGILRFNQLCEMVSADRASRNANDAEEWLMITLRQQAGGVAQMGPERVIDHARLQESLERTNRPIVHAYIEI